MRAAVPQLRIRAWQLRKFLSFKQHFLSLPIRADFGVCLTVSASMTAGTTANGLLIDPLSSCSGRPKRQAAICVLIGSARGMTC